MRGLALSGIKATSANIDFPVTVADLTRIGTLGSLEVALHFIQRC